MAKAKAKINTNSDVEHLFDLWAAHYALGRGAPYDERVEAFKALFAALRQASPECAAEFWERVDYIGAWARSQKRKRSERVNERD